MPLYIKRYWGGDAGDTLTADNFQSLEQFKTVYIMYTNTAFHTLIKLWLLSPKGFEKQLVPKWGLSMNGFPQLGLQAKKAPSHIVSLPQCKYIMQSKHRSVPCGLVDTVKDY